MVRSRISLIAVAAAVVGLAACGSDEDKGTSTSTAGNSSTTTSVAGTGAATTTTAAGTSTAVTVAPVTAATVAGVTTTAVTLPGATTTTAAVKGRNVTSPSDNVKLGDTGEGVKQIQAALKAAGYKVTVDGDFGNQTDAAVKAFQKKNGLTVDGIVGKITWGKLSGAGGSTTTTTK